ncbi:hypothetical protein [Rossellomorea vietnamensis]|nr:hypothetical protein [Rossellomorea vietnamensis]
MNTDDKVLYKDNVYYIFWIYPSGYLEIRSEKGKTELVEKTEIQLL